MALVPDEGAVDQFVANGADPPFVECVCSRSARWDGDDRAADSGEYVIERTGVLAGAVADHEPDGLVVTHEQVPGGLGGPGTGGVGGDPGEVHPSGVHFDEKQHVEPAQGDGVNAEEVSRHQAVGLGSDELAPRRSGPIRRRFATGLAQDLPDGGSCDAVAESAYLSMDTPVPPIRVLAVETQDEPTKLGGCGLAVRFGVVVVGVQWWATRRRCQLITVAGFTINMTWLSRRRSNARDNMARMVRSVGVNLGRSICRCSTRIWWRRARISASRLSPDTNNSPRRAMSSRNRCERAEDTAVTIPMATAVTCCDAFPAPSVRGKGFPNPAFRIAINSVEFHSSAFKHGYDESAILHAINHAVAVIDLDPDSDPPKVLAIGVPTIQEISLK